MKRHLLSGIVLAVCLILMAGVLPPEMPRLVNDDHPLLIGSELLEWFDIWLDLRGGEIVLRSR